MNSSFTFSASMPRIIAYDSPNQFVYSETLDLLTSSKANYTFLPTAELGYRRIRHNNDKGLVFGFLLTKNRFSAKSEITDNTSGERVELHMNGEDWRVLFQIGGVFIRDKWRYSFHSNMGFGASKDYNLEVRLYDPQDDLISKDGEGLKSSFYSADLTFGLGGFAAYSLNDHLETSLHYNIYWVNVSRKEVNSLSQAIFRWHGFLNNAISLQLAYAF